MMTGPKPGRRLGIATVETDPRKAVCPFTSSLTETARLVREAQAGDRTAFGELYARYARAVHGVVLSRVPWIDVEDLVHDVFVTALQRLADLRDAEAFGGWLLSIARNRATDHLRRTPNTATLTDDDVAARAACARSGGRTPDRVEALAVLNAIRSLPEAYRETLTLRLVEGMTGPEIAARTGLTAGSVRVNLHRGLKQLRERLAATRSS
jgi:RNA polymerase sigma-70 factor (ECF subfamily)